MRTTALLMTLALGLGACGGSSSPAVGEGQDLAVDAEGIITPDSSLRFDISQEELSVLIGADARTGERTAAVEVPEGLTVRTASPDGSAVALVEGEGGSVYEFTPRSSTRIVVVRPQSETVRSFDLPGNFEPEAFSTDASKMFLIEYLTDDGLRYRVRMMRLRSGRVLPVGRLTKFAPDSMRGTGRVQVYSPDFGRLYTLYTRQPPNYAHQDHDDVHNEGMVHAFVHVLDLTKGWAHCVDLPMPFGMDTEPANELRVSADGERLYASDGKRIAVVDTEELKATSIENVDASSGSE